MQSNKERLTNTILLIPSTKIPVDKIILDPSNPNKMTNQQLLGLEKFMIQHGFAVELWVNQNKNNTYLCIDGEHRVKVLQKNNIKSVYAKIFHVKPHEVKMMRQIANKLHGIHDKDKDAIEYKEIFDAGELDELADILDESVEDFENILEKNFDMSFEREETNDTPLPPAEPKSKLGDVYQLGNHRIMCGDSTNQESMNSLLVDCKPDLLLTDPPYGINAVNHNNEIGGTGPVGFTSDNNNGKHSIVKVRKYRTIIGDDKPFNPEFLLKSATVQIIFGANNFCDKLPVSSHWLVWDKKPCEQASYSDTFSDVELMWTNLYNYKNAKIYRHVWNGLTREGDRKSELKERVHPTQKPVGLLSDIIKDYSKENDTILDCFLGSGSTLIACESTDRICFGMEIDPGYIDVIIQRFINYVGSDKDVYLIKNDKKIPYSKINRNPTMKKLE